MARTRLRRLTRTEFYDIYGISLILNMNVSDSDKLFLVDILQPIVDRYLEITRYAVRAELRYFRRGRYNGCGEDIIDDNVDMLKELGIKNWKLERTKVSFKEATWLFKKGTWDTGTYGGHAWGDISEAGEKLEALTPVTVFTMPKVIMALDRLNDLEHNCNLYLAQYSSFHLGNALDDKADSEPSDIIRYCSDQVRSVWKDLK